jgi:hypothetical protein
LHFYTTTIGKKNFGKADIQSIIEGNFETNNYLSNFKITEEVDRKITTHIWLIGFSDVFNSLDNSAIMFSNLDNITILRIITI